ncbi:MAG: hypothetical protein ACK4TM_12050 [Yoonia sp.]
MKSLSCRGKRCMSIVCHMRHALPLLFVLAACADIPALDGTVTEEARNAPYPRLLPLDAQPAPIVVQTGDMDARVAALQRRAEALRRIDPGALQ